MDLSSMHLQSILQALKGGVVPPYGQELYHVGRSRETAEFDRCLDMVASGSGIVKIVTGEYGVGKSFFLTHLQKLAQTKKFVAASLQLNKNFKFNKFEEIYYQIMHNLAVDSSEITESGFEKMFDLWIRDLNSMPEAQEAKKQIQVVTESIHRQHGDFARAFLAYIRGRIYHDRDKSRVAASWIKGETNLPAALKQVIGVKGQVNRENALEFLSAFVHMVKCLGYQGLILMIDELESVLTVRSDIRQAIYENLRFLIDTQIPSTMMVFVGTDSLLADREKGLANYEPLAQRLGIPAKQEASVDLRQPVIRLLPLTLAEITLLTKKILMLHQIAYEWSPNTDPEEIRNWALFECHKGDNMVALPVNTRLFLQKLVKILDIMEQGKSMSIAKMKMRLIESNGKYILRLHR